MIIGTKMENVADYAANFEVPDSPDDIEWD